MSELSETLMRSFRAAVYERIANPDQVTSTPHEGIQRRSALYREWLAAVRSNQEAELLEADFVRHWAVADVLAFRQIDETRHVVTAADISQNISANALYAKILHQVDPGITEKVKSTTTTPPPIAALDSKSAPAEKNEPNGERPVVRFNGFAGTQVVRDTDKAPLNSVNTEEGETFDRSGHVSKLLESITYKHQPDGAVLYFIERKPAFSDHGDLLLMAKDASDDEDSILAAVLQAKEKFGGAFEITGSDEFKDRTLKIMLKYGIEARLKDPAQDALFRELKKSPASKNDEVSPPDTGATEQTVPLSVPTADTADTADNGGKKEDPPFVPPAEADQLLAVPLEPEPAQDDGFVMKAQGPSANDLIPVRATEWWSVQQKAINYWAKTDEERDADLKNLGPEPSPDKVYWFTKAGQPCPPPHDAETYLRTYQPSEPIAGFGPGVDEILRTSGAISTANTHAQIDLTVKELEMADATNKEDKPELILRGVKAVNGEFETVALLFKGRGDYLQGFVKVGDEKRQVIAHLNERKVDKETGEVKPNFITLSEPHGDGDDASWKQIGHGNAVNRRKDGKPVYFDEVLFNVGGEVIKARVTAHTDAELHKKLGFEEARQARPKNGDKADGVSDPSPKSQAPTPEPKATNQDGAGAEAKAKEPAPKAKRSHRASA